MRYYKVVRKDSLASAVVGENSKYNVYYKTGEWVYPKIGKLYVFDSLQSAADTFPYSLGYLFSVYECEVKNPIPIQEVAAITLDKTIEGFWNGNLSIERAIPPKGTIVCDAVKLIREVEWR